MYKVLIVDDESWVVESLKISIDWQQYGMRVIGAAYSGQEALEEIVRQQPDIVFTDVRMPGMSGLELIKKANDMAHPPLFVVVSGYAEFAYAQKALNFGAIGYCLKPYDETEIYALLRKVRDRLDASLRLTGEQFLSLLEDTRPDARQRIEQELRSNGLRPGEAPGLSVLVAAGEGKLPLSPDLPAYRTVIGRGKTAYIVACRDEPGGGIVLFGDWPKAVRGVGMSDPVIDYADLGRALAEANTLSRQYFITGRAEICRPLPLRREALDKAIAAIGEAVRSKDLAGISGGFANIGQLFASGGLTIKHAYHTYNMIVSMQYKPGAEQPEQMLDGYEQLLTQFGNVADMIDDLHNHTVNNLRYKPETAAELAKNSPLKAIVAYVNDNFSSDLSVQGLAQHFYIHPNYISQLFRKEVGETFTAYLAKLRMNYACQLLRRTELPINEIAEKAGYEDYFYFTRLFKKMTGKTPTQYRSME